ncbi:MAG: hypothetical protein LW834_07920 [Cyanobium sp. 49614_E6]|jgi:hypothetical protein|nr:hypothetical protein [Cyanobium sp. 49614_E6]
MALFNFTFSAPQSNNNDNNSDAGKQLPGATEKLPVVIQLNEEAITISADDAEGRTVEELFEDYGADLGDVNRINRFVAAGQIVSRDTTVTLGTVYRGSVTSESKGNN